jgi:hypothetical protein
MSPRRRPAVEALALVGLAAGSGYRATYATKHYARSEWPATPSLVLVETIWKLNSAPPTAAALGLAFGVVWGFTSLAGAGLGRTATPGARRAGP